MTCGPIAPRRGMVALLLCTLLPVMASARPSDLAVRFETFSGLDGLSSSNIGLMLQDQRGFMWFATDYGLNRYDGYTFKQYLHEPTDSTSIAGAYISNVVEDQQGALWIHLVIDGVTRFDPATESFRHFAHDAMDPGSIAPGSLEQMVCDSQGRQWFAFHGGQLDRYDPASGAFIHYGQGLRDFLGREAVSPEALMADNSGQVWFLTSRGELLRLQPETEEWRNVSWRQHETDGERLTALKLSTNNRLWMGTSRGRLLEVDVDGLSVAEHVVALPDSLEAPVITEILPSKHRQDPLWLNFCSDGIGRYDLAVETLTYYPANVAKAFQDRLVDH